MKRHSGQFRQDYGEGRGKLVPAEQSKDQVKVARTDAAAGPTDAKAAETAEQVARKRRSRMLRSAWRP